MKKQHKKALVLLNMGGISKKSEIKIFLQNMFNDKNIITTKSNILRALISRIVVFFRLNSAKKNYAFIKNKSPLLPITKSLTKKLSLKLADRYVTYAMAYTPPYSNIAIKNIKKRKIKDIYLFPMYPQYSTTTVKSSLEIMISLIEKEIPDAKITYIKRFYTNKKLIKLIVDDIIEQVPKNDDISTYNIVFSAHSLPVSIIEDGDSYEREIQDHTELIKKEFLTRGIEPNSFTLGYQSKLGPVKWLTPSLEHIIENMPSKKIKKSKKKTKEIKKAIIYPISFTIDNGETVYELAIEMKKLAKKNGFDKFLVCGCFNDRDRFVNIIAQMVK